MGAQLLCHRITKETAFAADDDRHIFRQAVRRFQDRRLFFMLCTGNGTVIKGIAIPHIIKQVAARLQCQQLLYGDLFFHIPSSCHKTSPLLYYQIRPMATAICHRYQTIINIFVYLFTNEKVCVTMRA